MQRNISIDLTAPLLFNAAVGISDESCKMTQITFDDTRLKFHELLDVMDVDFSHFAFSSNDDVNAVYDFIEARIAETKQRWYFLVNYEECRIDSGTWFQFALRGKDLNNASSLGSVRYSPPKSTGTEIRKRSEQEKFDSNLFDTRDEALVRIAQMRVAKQN